MVSQLNQFHENRSALPFLALALMLLAIAADANSVEEIMNSPEIKPTRPITNTAPIKISFCKLFMIKSSKVGKFFSYYNLTIVAITIVDNETRDIWIVS